MPSPRVTGAVPPTSQNPLPPRRPPPPQAPHPQGSFHAASLASPQSPLPAPPQAAGRPEPLCVHRGSSGEGSQQTPRIPHPGTDRVCGVGWVGAVSLGAGPEMLPACETADVAVGKRGGSGGEEHGHGMGMGHGASLRRVGDRDEDGERDGAPERRDGGGDRAGTAPRGEPLRSAPGWQSESNREMAAGRGRMGVGPHRHVPVRASGGGRGSTGGGTQVAAEPGGGAKGGGHPERPQEAAGVPGIRGGAWGLPWGRGCGGSGGAGEGG